MRFASIFVVACCLLSPLHASEPMRPSTVEQALATPANLAFDDAKLRDVAEWLSKKYRIKVFLDEASLADAKLSDVRITKSSKSDCLAIALMEVLKPYSLKWISEDEVLYLASAERWEHTVHVYRAESPEKAKENCERLKREYLPGTWSTADDYRDGRATAYGRAVVIERSSVDHFMIRRRFADVLTRLDADASNLLPAKLLAPCDVEFVDAKLVDVAKWFGKETGLAVTVDKQSLKDEAISSEVRFSKRITNVSMAAALDLLLREETIGWTCSSSSVSIASRESLQSEPMTAVYDARGLVLNEREDLVDLITSFVPGEFLPESNGQTPIKYAEPGYIVVDFPFEVQRLIAPVIQELRWALNDNQ